MERLVEYDKDEAGSKNLEFLPESTRSWWTSVLTGESETPHPTYGTDVAARLDGDTLILSGNVATMQEREEIGGEAERLKGHGIASVRNELEVGPEVTDEPGILVQTLVGIFENAELAGFARRYLEDRLRGHPQLAKVIGPDCGPTERAELCLLLPQEFCEDASKALDDGHALQIGRAHV
jgi:hypothetical protein